MSDNDDTPVTPTPDASGSSHDSGIHGDPGASGTAAARRTPEAPGTPSGPDAPPDDRRADDEEPAESPTGLGGGAWRGALRRMLGEFQRDDLTDRAAALTYYGILSIFPALLVLLSLLGLAGRNTLQQLIDNVSTAAPGPVRQLLVNALTQLQHSTGTAGIAGMVGLLVALWSASGYVAAFMRASNAVYDVPEGRPIWKTLPIRLGVTVVMMVLLVVTALIVVVTGGLAQRAGELIGARSALVTTWEIAKWPVLVIIVSFMFALLCWASPNAKQGFRWVSPGGLLAVILWILVSGGFALYVADFGSYNKTYGSLAGVVVALIWLWITNLAILLGAEFNAELERGRAIEAGHPPREEPYVELRDPPKSGGE